MKLFTVTFVRNFVGDASKIFATIFSVWWVGFSSFCGRLFLSLRFGFCQRQNKFHFWPNVASIRAHGTSQRHEPNLYKINAWSGYFYEATDAFFRIMVSLNYSTNLKLSSKLVSAKICQSGGLMCIETA